MDAKQIGEFLVYGIVFLYAFFKIFQNIYYSNLNNINIDKEKVEKHLNKHLNKCDYCDTINKTHIEHCVGCGALLR
jgi:hypothetical protein